ncbi:MAG TPA: hypothetical protein VFN11_03230 [Ktedonobacterales bacterium]|nr:hypothetical protein [Ktedonobacterales bacterium]
MPVAEVTATADPDGGTLDLLDVVDSLSNHYHEHLDAILAWSWRLFCARWARMLDAEARRMVRERERSETREQEQERRQLRQQLQQRGGGGGLDGW